MLGALGATIGIGLAYDIYSSEQQKKMNSRMAAEQKKEAARQASYANMGAASEARVAASAVAASTGGSSGGSTITGGMLSINSGVNNDARALAAATNAQIEQIGLQTQYNNAAITASEFSSVIDTAAAGMKLSIAANGSTGTGTNAKSNVAPYNPPTALEELIYQSRYWKKD